MAKLDFSHELRLRLEELLRAAIGLSSADFGSIQLNTHGTSELRWVAGVGFPEAWVEPWNRASSGSGTSGMALDSRSRVTVEDVERSLLLAGKPALEVLRRSGARSLQSTPIFSLVGAPLGVFSTYYQRAGGPDARTLRILDLIARQAGDIIELVEATVRDRLLLDTAYEGIVIASPQGRFSYVNRRFAEMLGYSVEEVLGRTSQELVFEDWRARVLDLRKELGSGRPLRGEFKFRHKDGSEVWTAYSAAAVYDDGGRQLYNIGMHTDITEQRRYEESLKRSEERFRSIFANVATGIAITDLQGVFLMCNPAYCALVGYSEAELGRIPFSKIIHPEDLGTNLELAGKVMSGEIPHFEVENRYLHKNGSTIWVRKFGSLIRDETGKPTHLIALVTDITERKFLEEELRAAILARDEFLSVASHELRTPLTALELQLELLRKFAGAVGLSPESRIPRLASSACQAIRSLNSLLDELLDVTRIRVGKLKLEPQEMDLRESLIGEVENLRDSAAASGSTISVRAEEPVRGEWDPRRIHQIVSNLLSNAIKYGDGKPIEARLMLDPGARFARIEIEDHGIGIPADMKEKVFERFQRASEGTRIAGLGLGLYIVRQVVEAHGGSIQLESEPGQGSTFTVLLPLQGVKRLPLTSAA